MHTVNTTYMIHKYDDDTWYTCIHSTINFYRETLTPVGLVLHPRRTAKREKAAEEKDAFCGGGVNC